MKGLRFFFTFAFYLLPFAFFSGALEVARGLSSSCAFTSSGLFPERGAGFCLCGLHLLDARGDAAVEIRDLTSQSRSCMETSTMTSTKYSRLI
jgi:hypothetical protein